jgi:AcrR family transcriptional regulator
MAYRKTEKVLAQIEARRNSIIASAIDVIAKSGMDGLTTDAVAARADVANGLMYKYFPDKAELVAAVFAKLLARDLDRLRMRYGDEKDALHALARAISAFHAINQDRLAPACAANDIYRKGIENEFYGLIYATGADLDKTDVKYAAKATMGALCGLAGAHGHHGKVASMAVLFVLRGIGVSGATARKEIGRAHV